MNKMVRELNLLNVRITSVFTALNSYDPLGPLFTILLTCVFKKGYGTVSYLQGTNHTPVPFPFFSLSLFFLFPFITLCCCFFFSFYFTYFFTTFYCEFIMMIIS
ncbi:hypothetical protein AB4K20DRAFT_1901294 [Rhizopus microsporus]